MQLRFVKVIVADQDKALEFYTKRLGFIPKADIMMGDNRFVTVAAPQGIEGVQLILESTTFKPTLVHQKACFKAGMTTLSINTRDIDGDFVRLKKLGVVFTKAPEDLGVIKSAVFEDSCGNLVHLVQAIREPR